MAVTIKNTWHRTLLVNVKGRKKPLRFMPRGKAEVAEKDIESPELKNLIEKGDLRILVSAKAKESAEKPKPGKEK